MINTSFLQDLLTTVAEQGRNLLPRALVGAPKEGINELAKALMSGRGEASGVAIAREVITRYRALNPEGRRAFFQFLARDLTPQSEKALQAATRYIAEPTAQSLEALQAAVESPRQEFFRRLNNAPGGTAEIVAMRRDLFEAIKKDPTLKAVDRDIEHLLSSWFNRGFLVLRRIDWQTPAAILEKIIAYEAVHEIQGWDDLRRRLDPRDRRCFAFFHPSLIDEPLIFVEVALTTETPDAIATVIKAQSLPKSAPLPAEPTTAVFYSISNCQEGLRGISFGNFLIKQVAEDLVKEVPSLRTFVTLSPVPGFAKWLASVEAKDDPALLPLADRPILKRLGQPKWPQRADDAGVLKATMLPLAAEYFLRARTPDGQVVDPVARFHLGNGARLERINWLGDLSDKGLREAHGLMVNYKYELADIEKNHEAFANQGEVIAAKAVKSLLRPQPKPATTSSVSALTTMRPKVLAGW
jgi:malonyl-CoA decarboxylase